MFGWILTTSCWQVGKTTKQINTKRGVHSDKQ